MPKISSPFVIVAKALSLYFNNYKLFLKLIAPLLPLLVLMVFQNYVVLNGGRIGNFTFDLNQWRTPFVIFTLFYHLIGSWLSACAILIYEDLLSGNNIDLKKKFHAGLYLTPRYVILNLLYIILVLFGTVIFIIPGIIFMVWFAFANYELVLGSRGIMESLKKSKQLVKGRFWKIILRLAVFVLLNFIIQITFGSLPYIGILIIGIIGPLLSIPIYLLYRELKSGGTN